MFVNVVGGVRVDEPRADLAVALAVASRGARPRGRRRRAPVVAFGEIGLTGELRSVADHDRRAEEVLRFSLERVISPDLAPTLRQALKLALGPQQARVRRARPEKRPQAPIQARWPAL